MVLLAMCDANYCFTLFNFGNYGSNNDSGVLANSTMGEGFEYGTIKLPNPSQVVGCDYDPLPYFILGDEIFPLKSWLLRPFGERNLSEEKLIYNYRHSRARRTIENTFGILVARWRIFSRPIRATVENTEKYVLACLALHNYLCKTHNACYNPAGFVDSYSSDGQVVFGDWRKEVPDGCFCDISRVRGSRYTENAIEMRDSLTRYLCTAGSVEWQQNYVRRTSVNQ